MGECVLTKSSGVDTSSLTAVAANVLAGKTAYVKDSLEPAAGAMANRGNVSQALKAGQSYTIPAGYHAGAGKVTASSLASQTQGTAGAYHILSNYVAWVNGSRIVGTNPGYDAGVTAADGRANPNSVNYQSGYNAGVAAGQAGRYRVASGSVAVGPEDLRVQDSPIFYYSPGFTPTWLLASFMYVPSPNACVNVPGILSNFWISYNTNMSAQEKCEMYLTNVTSSYFQLHCSYEGNGYYNNSFYRIFSNSTVNWLAIG